jgi:hypothetical protein
MKECEIHDHDKEETTYVPQASRLYDQHDLRSSAFIG